MFSKWMLVMIICILTLVPIRTEASIMKVEKQIDKQQKLEALYEKRKALMEAYLEMDKEIFELQRGVLEDIK